MADKAVTATAVAMSANGKYRRGIAGATIAAGKALFMDGSDANKMKLADADLSAAAADMAGVALHAAEPGQPVDYCYEDPDFIPGFTTNVKADNNVFILSATAGGIAPVGDLANPLYPVIVGTVKTAGAAGVGTISLKIQKGAIIIPAV